LEPWLGIARLPQALQAAGFEVGIACFEDDYLAGTRFRDRFFPWRPGCRRGGVLLQHLKAIVAEWPPDFLVPADDLAVVFLARAHGRLKASEPLAKLLKYSFGQPSSLLAAGNKYRTFQQAQQSRLRVPNSEVVSSESEALAFAMKNGFPFLLKQSFGWAGNEVAICHDKAEAIAVWKTWHRRPRWKQRFYAWRNSIRGRSLSTRWLPTDKVTMASQYITGQPAMCLVTAFEGQVLGRLTALSVESYPNRQAPSSVVHFTHNAEMCRAAEKLIRTWKLTGFIGFDFMIDLHGDAWLIECNPRPIPIAHLGARAGDDVCFALYCQLTGQPMPPTKSSQNLLVAHFPLESLRDPASPHLTHAFHDVPADDPDLMNRLARIGK